MEGDGEFPLQECRQYFPMELLTVVRGQKVPLGKQIEGPVSLLCIFFFSNGTDAYFLIVFCLEVLEDTIPLNGPYKVRFTGTT